MVRGNKRKSNQIKYRKNDEIKVREIRLVGDNVEEGVIETNSALKIARNMGLDLVEISSQPNQSICKVLDYDKFIFEEKKKLKELGKKNKVSSKKPKEVRLGPNTGEHDLEFKAKQSIGFLEKGYKVYVNILFKGRTIIHKDRGELTLLKFATLLKDVGSVEKLPNLNGRKMDMMIKPIK